MAKDKLSEYGKDQEEKAQNEQFEVCKAAMIWAKTPGNHGGNPYQHRFVIIANNVMAKHFSNPDYTLEDLKNDTGTR